MEASKMRELVIEKLIQLPEDEVAKVLIFIAGLDAGTRIGNAHPAEPEENS